jgi:hypothetical protein
MSTVVGGCGPISWADDRVGVPHSGAFGVIWRETMRFGYLRHLLGEEPAMATADLAALLACAPELIVADSGSRGADRPARAGRLRRLIRRDRS